MLTWAVRRGFGAMNRSDVDLVVMAYEVDAEIRMSGMSGVGIKDRYIGHEGIRELYADLDEADGDWAYRVREVVDLVDQVAVRADFLGHGRSSGAATTLSDVGTLLKDLCPGHGCSSGVVRRVRWLAQDDQSRRALTGMKRRVGFEPSGTLE